MTNPKCHGRPTSHCTVLDLSYTLTVIAAVAMIRCDGITSENGVFFAPFIVQNDKSFCLFVCLFLSIASVNRSDFDI